MTGDEYPFDSLTRQMVISQLDAVEDAPEEAAKIVALTIITGIKGTQAAGSQQTPRHSVRLVVKGMLEGLLALDQNLTAGAVAVLRRLGDAADKIGQDRAAMMEWALEGIVDGTAMLGASETTEIQAAIEKEFTGLGDAYSRFLAARGANA